MSATVRKNFAFEASVAEHLEELAVSMHTSLTKVVQELIEERYSEILKRKKIEAAMSIVGSSNGVFGDLTIQEIKANRNV